MRDVAKLDEAVAQGRLLKLSITRPYKKEFHVYAKPEHIEDACAFYHLGEKNTSQGLSPEEQIQVNRLIRVFGIPPHLSRWERFSDTLNQILRNPSDQQPVILGLIKNFLEGRSPGLCLDDQDFKDSPFQKAVAVLSDLEKRDLIVHRHETYVRQEPITIYGQPGQEKNMQDMGYCLQHYLDPELEKEGLTARWEGKILGFTDNDVNLWCDGLQKMNPVGRFLMQRTNGLRRECRVQLMLMEAAEKNKDRPTALPSATAPKPPSR